MNHSNRLPQTPRRGDGWRELSPFRRDSPYPDKLHEIISQMPSPLSQFPSPTLSTSFFLPMLLISNLSFSFPMAGRGENFTDHHKFLELNWLSPLPAMGKKINKLKSNYYSKKTNFCVKWERGIGKGVRAWDFYFQDFSFGQRKFIQSTDVYSYLQNFLFHYIVSR